MKVRMVGRISGTRDGEEWPAPGEVVALPDGEAVDLCAAGLAEPVAANPERATSKSPESRKR